MRNKNLEKEILSYLAPEGKLIAQRCLVRVLQKRDWYDYLKSLYTDLSFPEGHYQFIREILYRLLNGIDERPKCKICGAPLVFNTVFPNYCSRKCSNADPEVLEKNREAVRRVQRKNYETRGEEILAKRKATIKERYGVETNTPYGIPEVQEKIKKVIKEKFGVDNVLKLESTREKRIETSRRKSELLQKERGFDIEYLPNGNILVKNGCEIHGDIEVTTGFFNNRTKPERILFAPLCPKCNPERPNGSYIETFIENLLKENNVEYILHDHKILEGKELDFYIPSKNIAIECNGVFWHSETFLSDKNYHQTKSILAQKKGIQILHIWEDDFNYNREIIVSMIKSKLGLLKNKIYARDCEIQEVSSKISRNFLEKNHIQGPINSSLRYGLYHQNELVALMTLGQLRKCLGSESKEGVYELYRYATKLYTKVIGGASKLLKHFEKSNPDYKEIISYAKFDYSHGNLYYKLGFEFEKLSGPNYFWVIKYKRENRFKYRKNVISTEETADKTEVQIMHNKNYFRCYDSGSLKFVKKNPNQI